MKKIELILSCEHAVNTVPEAYQALFAPYQELLQTHRGIDFGALAVARTLSSALNCDFVQAKATRLLVDCNRSLSHNLCFSEITNHLPKEEKNQLIENYYLPYRQDIEQKISNHIDQAKRVLHMSIHSFTPVMNGHTRNGDLGLLYDPKRASEKILVNQWQKAFKQIDSRKLKVRLNYPYLGKSDGFTTALRKKFSDQDYAGIEIEINQGLVGDSTFLDYLSDKLIQSLKPLLIDENVG